MMGNSSPIIKEKKLNDQKIQPIKLIANSISPEKIKGYDVIPKLYANIFICAKKGSGKTNVIWRIIKNCADKNSFIYIFSGTAHNDENWEYIMNELDKKEIGYEIFLDTFYGYLPIYRECFGNGSEQYKKF